MTRAWGSFVVVFFPLSIYFLQVFVFALSYVIPFLLLFQWRFMNTRWCSRPLCSPRPSSLVWLRTRFSPNVTSASSELGRSLFTPHVCFPLCIGRWFILIYKRADFFTRLFAGLWILIIAGFMRVSVHECEFSFLIQSEWTLVKPSIGTRFPACDPSYCVLFLHTRFSSTTTRWSWCAPAPVLCSSAALSSTTHTFWCASCRPRSTYWPPSTSTWT